MNEKMEAAVEGLMENIVADYDRWITRYEIPSGGALTEEFADSLHFKVGNKYVKVISGGSVWGFVVNTENDAKFAYGDILKAAGWATPARNSARGNVFEEYDIRWTGPLYLR